MNLNNIVVFVLMDGRCLAYHQTVGKVEVSLRLGNLLKHPHCSLVPWFPWCPGSQVPWFPGSHGLTEYSNKIRQRDISGSGWDIFLEFLEAFLTCWYTGSKIIQIFCMSVSLVVDILPYWNPTDLGISPALDEISFWMFMDTFLGCWYTCSKYLQNLKSNFKYLSTYWIFFVCFEIE